MFEKRLVLFVSVCLLVMATVLYSPDTQAAVTHLTAETAACFTPDEDCTALIAGAINSARSEVLVQAFSFTSRPISAALINAFRRGVRVEILLDPSFDERGKNSAVHAAVDSGIPVYIDSLHKIAHNKIIIIDAGNVITGSFNFTHAAQYDNAENVVMLKSAELAGVYKRHFLSHKKHSRPYDKPYKAGHEKKFFFKVDE